MVKCMIALKPFVHNPKEMEPKFCSTCGSRATLEPRFDVGGRVIMIEKYCDTCSKMIARRM